MLSLTRGNVDFMLLHRSFLLLKFSIVCEVCNLTHTHTHAGAHTCTHNHSLLSQHTWCSHLETSFCLSKLSPLMIPLSTQQFLLKCTCWMVRKIPGDQPSEVCSWLHCFSYHDLRAEMLLGTTHFLKTGQGKKFTDMLISIGLPLNTLVS